MRFFILEKSEMFYYDSNFVSALLKYLNLTVHITSLLTALLIVFVYALSTRVVLVSVTRPYPHKNDKNREQIKQHKSFPAIPLINVHGHVLRTSTYFHISTYSINSQGIMENNVITFGYFRFFTSPMFPARNGLISPGKSFMTPFCWSLRTTDEIFLRIKRFHQWLNEFNLPFD